MARNGFFTGLDIGTSSIKVLVAELISGEMNVIGVSNVTSTGVKDGIIVDIEAAAEAIKTAVEQAEEKAGIKIEKVNVGLPANLLQIEPTQGMIPVTSESKEIKDEDDKAMLIEYTKSKITMIDWYISLLEHPEFSKKYTITQSAKELNTVKNALNNILKTIINFKIDKDPYNLKKYYNLDCPKFEY